MISKTEETEQEQETVRILTTQKDIKKKLDELAGTNNDFEVIFPPGSLRYHFDPKTDKPPRLSIDEKGYKLHYKIPENEGMIGDSVHISLDSIEKVTIQETDQDDRKAVTLYMHHRLD